jgi:hypothetical protein
VAFSLRFWGTWISESLIAPSPYRAYAVVRYTGGLEGSTPSKIMVFLAAFGHDRGREPPT